MVASPALPFCGGRALALERVAISAVVPSEGVVPVAQVECVVPYVQAIAAGTVLPCGATAEGDDDTAAAQVVPGRANQVVPRGSCRATHVDPGRGLRVPSGPSVVALLEKVVPVERNASWR